MFFEQLPKVDKLWAGMADGSEVLQLDAIFGILTLLTLLHASSKRGLLSGAAVVALLFAHTAAFEHMSLFLGGTHCHASSPLLPMITPCSTINSILFYVPWTYTSIEAARRLNLHPLAFPFAVGLLQFGFGAVYEMQGPWNNFWQWPDTNRQIANSPLLVPWTNYPPIAALDAAKAGREVATLQAGVFRVSEHAWDALVERLFMFPLFAPYFHFAYGFGWAAGLSLTGGVDPKSQPSLFRLLVAGVLCVGLFLLPIWATRAAADATAQPLSIVVPASLALSVLPLLLFKRTGDKGSSPQGSDPLLFCISLGMQIFFVSYLWRSKEPNGPTPSGLVLLVVGVAVTHLVAQFRCCFPAGQATIKKTQ